MLSPIRIVSHQSNRGHFWSDSDCCVLSVLFDNSRKWEIPSLLFQFHTLTTTTASQSITLYNTHYGHSSSSLSVHPVLSILSFLLHSFVQTKRRRVKINSTNGRFSIGWIQFSIKNFEHCGHGGRWWPFLHPPHPLQSHLQLFFFQSGRPTPFWFNGPLCSTN